MPSTGLWDNVAAIAAVPILLWLLACGFGLLAERAAKVKLPNSLLVGLGFCLSVIVALGIYTAGANDDVALPLMAVLAVLGFAVAGRDRFRRLNAGWPMFAALATYLLFNASVIMSGHWTFTGYNLENDSAYELLLVAHLQAHGTHAIASNAPISTANTALASYLSTGYPLGSQSLLAVVSGLLGVSGAVAWQGFISTMAAIGATACSTLSGKTMDRRVAALTGFLAVAAALTYQYALQGSIKEVAMVAAVLISLAVSRHALLALRPIAGVTLSAIPLGAILAIYSAAGVPYVGALAAAAVLAIPFVHRVEVRSLLQNALRPAAAGIAVLLLCAIPALPTFTSFLNVVNTGYTGSQATAPSLGPLVRPLPLSEISGVWLFGDYRFAVPSGSAGVITTICTVIIFALIAPALLRTVAAREPGPLMGLFSMSLVLAVVLPRAIPYAQAKVLMIASPVVILVAAQGLTGFRGRDWRVLCALAGAGLGTAVLASDALAYHQFPVAPVTRLLALEEAGRHLGAKGPVLDSEFEQFAKYFALPARIVDGPDAPTPMALALRTPTNEYDHSFDLDEEQLPFVESFPYILVRRAPTSSRPPSNFQPIYSNAYYTLWRRTDEPTVLAHMPLGEKVGAAGKMSCEALRAFVQHAPPKSRLAVALPPQSSGFRLVEAATRSPGWTPSGNSYDEYFTTTPGSATGRIRLVSSGSYTIWVQGDMPRTVSVTLDGRPIGSVNGTDTPGGWLSAGKVTLAAGSYELGVERGGGGIAPGNGSTQASLGAVALLANTPERVIARPLGAWKSLCGKDADWVELTR